MREKGEHSTTQRGLARIHQLHQPDVRFAPKADILCSGRQLAFYPHRPNRTNIASSACRNRDLSALANGFGPPVSPPTKPGFGSRLLQRGIFSAPDAVTVTYEPEGLRCDIDVDLRPDDES